MLSYISSVTVIMRTKNSADILGQTLKALFSQKFTNFKLLIIDSSSTDGSLEIAKSFECNIESLPANEYFPGKILNQAVQSSKSEIIVFLNSDAVMLTPNTLESLLEAFIDQKVQAAFGRQIPRPDAKSWVRSDYLKCFPPVAPAAEWIPFALPLAAIRRTAWQQRPFYTDAWGSEDTEWGHWAQSEGKDISYVPNAAVMHSHNYTFRQLYGRRFIEGEADAFIYRKPYPFMQMIGRIVRSIASDIVFYIRAGDLLGLFEMPLIRIVDRWAYYKGYMHGKNRIVTGNKDASIGQNEVLKRYE